MRKSKLLRLVWTMALIVLGAVLVYLAFSRDFDLTQRFPVGVPFLVIFFLAFFAEYIDSSLGMGYGLPDS